MMTQRLAAAGRPVVLMGLLMGIAAFYLARSESAAAAEPGWSPVVVARGDYRRQLDALPIQQRPYRPLHFYGNTVRRMTYRGTPLPLVRSNVATGVPGDRFFRAFTRTR